MRVKTTYLAACAALVIVAIPAPAQTLEFGVLNTGTGIVDWSAPGPNDEIRRVVFRITGMPQGSWAILGHTTLVADNNASASLVTSYPFLTNQTWGPTDIQNSPNWGAEPATFDAGEFASLTNLGLHPDPVALSLTAATLPVGGGSDCDLEYFAMPILSGASAIPWLEAPPNWVYPSGAPSAALAYWFAGSSGQTVDAGTTYGVFDSRLMFEMAVSMQDPNHGTASGLLTTGGPTGSLDDMLQGDIIDLIIQAIVITPRGGASSPSSLAGPFDPVLPEGLGIALTNSVRFRIPSNGQPAAILQEPVAGAPLTTGPTISFPVNISAGTTFDVMFTLGDNSTTVSATTVYPGIVQVAVPAGYSNSATIVHAEPMGPSMSGTWVTFP